MGSLRAGAGVIDITPAIGAALSGSFAARYATTVDSPLSVRALVLDDGEIKIALVVCDLIDIARDVVIETRQRIAEQLGMPGERVMISCTHTHTGPVLTTTGDEVTDPGYLAALPGKIADAVALADSRLAPARIAAGVGDVQGVCFNRRWRTSDGRVTMNWRANRDDGFIEPVGPVDPQVTALLVETPAGSPVALWANLSLHYVGTDNDRGISADYYGKFAREIGRLLGDQCIGLLSNGTSGNINTIDVDRQVEETGEARSRLVATAVAATAAAATLMQQRHDDLTLAARTVSVPVQRREIPAEDIALSERILASPDTGDDQPSNDFSFTRNDPMPARWVRLFAGETLAVAAMPEDSTAEVQVMRIGPLGLVALPGEIFVEFGLAIKAAAPFANVAVVSLANGDLGYVPTEEAFAQGGYETWTARSAWVAPGTGERLVDAALEELATIA